VAVAGAGRQRHQVVLVKVLLADPPADQPMAHLQPAQELLAKEMMVELEAVLQALVLAAAAVQVQPVKVVKLPKVAMEE
jgi:hypothetical protein